MKPNRELDDNGFETYNDCKFFCECVAQYLGKEIDIDGRYGLNPNNIYNVYRPKSEITKPEFLETLNAKPIMDDHYVIGTAEGMISPDKKHSSGVLSEVKVVGNELHGRIDVWSPSLINKIHNGKRELSLAYGCDFVPKRGTFNGQKYDFIQSNLRCGNHLAFVDEARNGHDCCVKDGMFVRDEKIQLEIPDMDISKLSADEVVEALKGCSDEVRAKCKDFLNTPTEEEKKAAEEKAIADAEAEEKAKAEAEAKAEELKKAEEEKAAEDAKKAEEEKAMACEKAVEDYKDAVELAEDCKSVFGSISMDGIKTVKDLAIKVCSLDSAPKFLKDCKPDGAVVALRGYIAGRDCGKSKTIATDSVSAKQAFSDYMKTR